MKPEMTTRPYTVEHWTHVPAAANYRSVAPHTVTVNDRAATRQAIIDAVRHQKIEFIERSDWAAHKNRAIEMADDWDYSKIAIHHAGRSYSCGPAALQMQEIQRLHMTRHKWPDIGYHYAIDCAGNIYEGRDIRFKGSHLDRYNTGVIGIVFLENLSVPADSGDATSYVLAALRNMGLKKDVVVPNIQKDNARKFIAVLRQLFAIVALGGHQEFPKQNSAEARLCPGSQGMDIVEEIRSWSGLPKP